MTTCDAVVIGLGAMGSAAVASLARRGCRVVGIERFEPGHDRGSSHGATRIIRQGYFEHPSYVPLVRAAYPLWRELAAEAGEPLITITGIVEIGAAVSELVTGTLAASRQHGLAHDVLDAAELRRRFPLFEVPDHYMAVFQPDGGFLRAEPAIRALLARARAAGAELRTGETVRAIEPRGAGVRVVTTRGTIDAGCAVVAAGAWVKTLLRSSGRDPGDAPGARLVRAARSGAVLARTAFRCSCSRTRTGCSTAFPTTERDRSRSQSTITPTRPSTPTAATASYRRPTRR